MTARDAGGVDPDRCVRCAAENVLAIGQRNLPRLPHQPAPDGRRRRLIIGKLVSNVTDEPVPKPVDGTHEPRMVGRICQSMPDLLDETREIGVEDEGRRPQVRLELRPRHSTSVVLDEHKQKIERLAGTERHLSLRACGILSDRCILKRNDRLSRQ